jgi:hypothetical protein
MVNNGEETVERTPGQSHSAHVMVFVKCFKVQAMKSRYLFLAASVPFLILAVVEFRHNVYAAVLNAVAGAIFLFLGVGPQRRT